MSIEYLIQFSLFMRENMNGLFTNLDINNIMVLIIIADAQPNFLAW